MSTNSLIARTKPDGSVESIYCHYDGYPAGVGRTLELHYQAEEKLNQLFELGDLSSLGKEIGIKREEGEPRVDGWCEAGHRDRGGSWENTKPELHSSVAECLKFGRQKCGAEYVYLHDGEGWEYYDVAPWNNKDKPLEQCEPKQVMSDIDANIFSLVENLGLNANDMGLFHSLHKDLSVMQVASRFELDMANEDIVNLKGFLHFDDYTQERVIRREMRRVEAVIIERYINDAKQGKEFDQIQLEHDIHVETKGPFGRFGAQPEFERVQSYELMGKLQERLARDVRFGYEEAARKVNKASKGNESSFEI